MNLSDIKLAIIGLGYVGLPLAVEFGKKRPVVGFDINQKRIDELNAGHDFMGAAAIRAPGKPEHVLYDLKYLLPASASDLRL